MEDLCDHCLQHQFYAIATHELDDGTPVCQLCIDEVVFNAC